MNFDYVAVFKLNAISNFFVKFFGLAYHLVAHTCLGVCSNRDYLSLLLFSILVDYNLCVNFSFLIAVENLNWSLEDVPIVDLER